MRVLVGIGEGVGNVVMGLPLIDALLDARHEVWAHLRPTPPELAGELAAIISRGRERLVVADDGDLGFVEFDAACLTHWWLTRGLALPRARETYVGGPPSADVPEILANLDAASALAPAGGPTARLYAAPRTLPGGLRIGIHPGCKPEPEWRARKVYPRWAEVTHRLKYLGAHVTIVGTAGDVAYCGEPHQDLRGMTSLPQLVDVLSGLDVVVSGDSGVHHLAVALGVPTVALFGASSVTKAAHPAAAIAPRVFGPCDTPEAFAAIDPLAVATAAVEAADRRAAA